MGVDSITIDGTVPVPARTTACDPIVRKDDALTPSRTVGDLVSAWPTPQIHGGCTGWVPVLASDFGEAHETQVAFARTFPHRTDPACLMGRDRPGTDTRRSHRSGDGHVRRAHPGRERDGD